MDPKKEKELVRIIKDTLIKEQKVTVPNLGVLEVYHEKQKQEQRSDGQVVLNPPCDKVRLKPIKKPE